MIRPRHIQSVIFAALILVLGCTACITVNNPQPATTANPPGNASTPASTQASPPTTEPTTLPTAQSATETPISQPTSEITPPPSVIPRLRRVVLVEAGESLPVYQNPLAGSPEVHSLSPIETGLVGTGREQDSGGVHWVELNLPNGQPGWVDGFYLSEDIAQADVCADPQAQDLIRRVDQAFSATDGDALEQLVSPAHGLFAQLYHSGNTVNYSPEETGWVFKSTYQTDWGSHPASGMDIVGTFSDMVLPDYLQVFESDYTISCMEMKTGGISYEAAQPAQFRNMYYFTLYKPGSPGVDLDWRTVVAGIEYVGGVPWLVYLQQFFWEP